MTPSPKILAFMKVFEKLMLKAYPDPGSKNGLPITIGYGSTFYEDGSRIKMGDVITEEKARKLFEWEVNTKTKVLNAMKLNLNQNQFDALVSFVYNVGVGAFNNSDMKKKIKLNPNDPSIEAEFMRWTKNDGKVLKGLVTRRKEEAKIYFTHENN